MSYITMSVIKLVIRPISQSMRSMSYVRYKCLVSIVTGLYFQSYVNVHYLCIFRCLVFKGCRGSFGDGCLFPCPITCQDGKCNTYSGYCDSCHAGYYGQACNNGLSFNYYIIFENCYSYILIKQYKCKCKIAKQCR